MMGIVKIATLSYLNAIPFLYGLEYADANLSAELLLDTPSSCARNFASGLADIALVPVGVLPSLTSYQIVTPYCISAEGRVESVELLSNYPIEKINTIYLDSHSRTSNELVKILCRDLWGIAPQWRMFEDAAMASPDKEGVAYLMIGDKVFDHRHRFSYEYDLAEAWIELTGKPFVFAVWVARVGIDPNILAAFEESLRFGVSNIDAAVKKYRGVKCYDKDIKYLTKNIKFGLNKDKREVLELFIRNLKNSTSDSGGVG